MGKEYEANEYCVHREIDKSMASSKVVGTQHIYAQWAQAYKPVPIHSKQKSNAPNFVGIALGHRKGCRTAGMRGGAIAMGGKRRDGEGARRGRDGNEGRHK